MCPSPRRLWTFGATSTPSKSGTCTDGTKNQLHLTPGNIIGLSPRNHYDILHSGVELQSVVCSVKMYIVDCDLVDVRVKTEDRGYVQNHGIASVDAGQRNLGSCRQMPGALRGQIVLDIFHLSVHFGWTRMRLTHLQVSVVVGI